MKIVSIHIYPIKSLGGISLQSSKVFGKGLAYDRRWVLIDGEGLFQSQRTLPNMALFSVLLNKESLTVNASDGSEINIPFTPVGERRKVIIWDDEVEGREVSAHTSSWFSKHLGKEVYLVSMNEETNRLIDVRYASNSETVSFADGYPLLLANTASMVNLNDRLEEAVKMNRFRPNIVVEGQQPFEEDNWGQLSIGAAQIEVVKRCARCVVVDIDPQTASKGKEVLQTLSGYRKTGSKVFFGVNALVHKNGIIKIGDQVVKKSS
ncbi:MAG: MOSC domain-containing protein [Cyclobacteriaceae bacterium]|nr:MOSC domain-containing protein [Cyclobacteriaceae bacterium]